jgi:hypothetical protein
VLPTCSTRHGLAGIVLAGLKAGSAELDGVPSRRRRPSRTRRRAGA